MNSSKVLALSIHADYRCRHSGACCSADWDVPVELPVYRSLRAAVDSARLRPAHAVVSDPFIVEPDLPDEAAAMLERTPTGACVFLDGNSRLCVVHRDLGESALPSTCRHFPRLAVCDRRGISITLSHFCPTAASMLFRDDRPLSIVRAPSSIPPAEYEGLRITADDLPPLLAPTMLMNLEGYAAWEAHMVKRCASVDRFPESVLATLARDAAILRRWTPGSSTLPEAIAELPSHYVDACPPQAIRESLAHFVEVMNAVPDDLRPVPDDRRLEAAFADLVRPAWGAYRAPLNRYLGAKAFASWTAYQGRGIATVVRGLESALALVRVEASRACRNAGRRLDQALLVDAIRGADFALNHLAVGEDLARAWSSAEA